jgi:NAD(P)-dependent dehydrogenase (short-subunit alcohol dehydrogenase family)
VITGAASGIGGALALALAREGANLALLDIDSDALERIQSDLAATGVRTLAVVADVSQRDDVFRSVETVGAEFGDVHVLCSNAGVTVRGAPLYQMDPDTFDWMLHVNVGGTFNVTRAYIPAMLHHGGPAHVVLTASSTCLYELPGRENGAYASGKMAVLGMAQSLRASLRGSNVGVTAVVPAIIATNIQQSGRHRPARYGGPFDRPDAAAQRAGMPAGDVARVVLRAMAEGDFLAITHPAGRELLDAQYGEAAAAHERWEAILTEMQIDPTQPVL